MMRPVSPEDGSQEGRVSHKPIVPPKCFPHCIVWSPIPLVTWFIPFIGHLGALSPLSLLCVQNTIQCSAIATSHESNR